MSGFHSHRIHLYLVAAAGILLVLFIGQLSVKVPADLDFTEEKKFTLHPSVESVLGRLTDQVNIEVYMGGELPPNFQRFRNSIERVLDQMVREAGSNLEYRFTDPSVAASAQARNLYYRKLIEMGIQPSNVSYTRDGQKTERLVFPGAVISYQGKEMGITLLKGNRSKSIEEMLNQSIEGMEYEIANAIKQLSNPSGKRVGFIIGHNEPDTSELAGFTNAILGRYDLYRIDLSDRQELSGYDVIILGKPAARFEEREKYLIDQYIMKGGNMLVFYDALSVDMNQAHGEGTIAFPYETNLEDLFFRYGVRINQDYIADVNCGNTPVVTGMVGDQPRIELLPWPYWPIITNYAAHPLVRNLDATSFRGTSTIDTVKAEGIRKTPLMFTSEYTRVFSPPVRISYNDLNDKLLPERFTAGPKPVGYLLEGEFTSLFKNRFPPAGMDRTTMLENSFGSKIIIVSDGDFIRNDFNLENDNPLPMGADPYSQTNYANEDFLLNALDYLVDEDQLMLARNREVRIRPLDRAKVQNQGPIIKWINVFGPLGLIIVLGLTKYFIRRRKYGLAK